MSLKSIYRKYEKYLSNSSQRLRVRKQCISEWIDVLSGSNARLIRSIKLTKDEKKEIEDYWKEYYGRKIPLLWHRCHKAYSGKLDKRYFPNYMYTAMLEPKLQNDRITRTLMDKNLFEFLFARELNEINSIVIPKTICGCSYGYYFDSERCPVSRKKCEDIVSNLDGEFIIKPSVGECSGHGVRLLKMVNGVDEKNNQKAGQIIDEYKKDFIIQEKVKLNKEHEKLNPSSVNTIRVCTYRKDDGIKAAPPIMRIGRAGSHLDNAHAGGMYIAVYEDSSMGEYAVDCDGNKYRQHPDTGIVFSKYKVPYIKNVIESAKKLHTCLPGLTFANWDLCVSDKNEIVLIEVNLYCAGMWIFQNVHGVGVFGDDTEYMIQQLKKTK